MNTYYVRYIHDRGHPYQVLADSHWRAAMQFHNIPARPGETGGPVAVSVWTEAEWAAAEKWAYGAGLAVRRATPDEASHE